MPKAIAIDYGQKRTGLAITDSLMMIGSPLETIPTEKLRDYLSGLFLREDISVIVVGEARYSDGSESDTTKAQAKFVEQLRGWFPKVTVERADEIFTSKLAMHALVAGGMKKKERRNKENLDKVSAAIILQSWLDQRDRRG